MKELFLVLIFYKDISINDYSSMFTNNWNLKSEAIKYCEQDCISLYQIIEKFNNLIFNKFNLNVHRFPTLPSLALGIFKTHYMKPDQIPIINGQMYNEIRGSYTGGHTDLYKPFGKNIFSYDINSLYPTVMHDFNVPVGNPIYFEGDITKFDKDAFGFFDAEVKSPEFMNRPILQTKVKINNMFRTIAPLGTWNDMIFSEEMYNSIKYGYSFKVSRGYLFEKANIFKDYITDLYEIKKSHDKNDPMYLISKLLMNSLYGRFGLSNELSNHLIVTESELDQIIANKNINIKEVIDLENGKNLISLNNSTDNNLEDYNGVETSISIAAAITSYARINMSVFLCDPSLDILYTDTDSIFTTTPLSSILVGKKLGQMKLEGIFSEIVFLCPKVYGGLMNTASGAVELNKAKGLKGHVSYETLKSLLIKDNKVIIPQEKWFKNIGEGNISIKQSLYTLVATQNKRQFIYKDNKIIDTKPYVIDSNKQIK